MRPAQIRIADRSKYGSGILEVIRLLPGGELNCSSANNVASFKAIILMSGNGNGQHDCCRIPRLRLARAATRRAAAIGIAGVTLA